jgi:hypothetical protein
LANETTYSSPHNGRNITAQDIGNAIFQSTNWAADFGLFPANAALKNLNLTVLNLEDLNSPAGGEHPASLTRKDASAGDSLHIDTARVQQLLADSSTSFLTIESVAKSRNRVDKVSKPPPTAQELGVGQGEAALMMLLMRDTYVSLQTSEQDLSKLRAPKDRTRVWLLQEEFPTAQGWRPAEEVVQIADLGPVNTAIVASQAAQKGSS